MKYDIRPLTSIRGIAAIYVVLYHSFTIRGVFLNHGYIAVDLFFVLSGFVMGLSYWNYFICDVSFNNYAAFVAKRLLRIYPLYLFCTFLNAWILMSLQHSVVDGMSMQSSLLYNVVMVQAWGFSGSINYPSWSLSAEWFAYLIFPFITLTITKIRSKIIIWALIITVTGILIGLSFVVPPDHVHKSGPLDVAWNFSFLPVIRCVVEFSIGMLAFMSYDSLSKCRYLGYTHNLFILIKIILILLFFAKSDLLLILLFPMLIIGLTSGSGAIHRVLSWSPLVLIGELSYAIYLLHPIALYIGNNEVQSILHTYVENCHNAYLSSVLRLPVKAQIYPVIIIISYVVHHGLERPLQSVSRYLFPKKLFQYDRPKVMSPEHLSV